MSTFTAKKKLGGSFSQITDDDKGILTVTVTGAKNLEVGCFAEAIEMADQGI